MIDSDLADSDRRTRRGVHLTVRARETDREKDGRDRFVRTRIEKGRSERPKGTFSRLRCHSAKYRNSRRCEK